MNDDRTTYSAEIKGDDGNWGWPVRFDKSEGGYLGITQTTKAPTPGATLPETERVLLSPNQVASLLKFYAGKLR